MPTTATLATAVLLLACTTTVLAAAFFRLRRRHRDLRHTLVRVATERDQARMDLHGQPQPTGVRAYG